MLLNLSRLNLKTPYPLWPGKRLNEFQFKTDYGVTYNVSFFENQLIWDKDVYDFAILPLGEWQSSPNDKKLKQTVIAVIEEFFLEKPNVLLYQCETGDSKQAMRARLFQRWFDDYKYKEKYFVKVVVLLDENVKNYDAILLKRNNPHFDEIIEQFDKFVVEMSQKP